MAKTRAQIRQKVAQKLGPQYDQEVAEIGRQRGRLDKGFAKQRDSIKGAAAAAISATNATSLKGLKGPYRKQVMQEISGRSASLQNAIPGMLAPVQSDYKASRLDLADALRANSLDRTTAIKEELQARLMDRKDARVELEEDRGKARAETNNAVREGLRMARWDDELNDGEGGYGDKLDLPSSDDEWLQFEDALRKQEGVDPTAARKAVEKLQRRLRKAGAIGRGAWG